MRLDSDQHRSAAVGPCGECQYISYIPRYLTIVVVVFSFRNLVDWSRRWIVRLSRQLVLVKCSAAVPNSKLWDLSVSSDYRAQKACRS